MAEVSFPVKKTVFSAEILLKAAYNFIDQYYVHFDETAEEWIVCVSKKKDDVPDNNLWVSKFHGEFENELISQTVRHNIYQRTHNVRELLLARAMTTSMIDEGDPLETIAADSQDISEAELKDILTDWFEKYEH